MCGIVGYTGKNSAYRVVIEGLKKLEYRGYDSAGIATLSNGAANLIKTKGRLEALERKINGNLVGKIGIGHTRWATHGRPSDENSHPHACCSSDFFVVHNGIIENYLELKNWLQAEGHIFKSETDTEVLPHLVEHFYQGDFLATLDEVMSKVVGSYALVIMSRKHPEVLACARQDSPLVIGCGEGENFIASDIPAILNYTRRVIFLENGEKVFLADTTVVFGRCSFPCFGRIW